MMVATSVCSECQSGSKQARVNGRSNHDPSCMWCVVSSLVFLSSLSHVLHLHTHIDVHVHVGVPLFCSFYFS